LYEEKIIDLFKSKIKINNKEITIKEAEKIITEFNKSEKNSPRYEDDHNHNHNHNHDHDHNHDHQDDVVKEKKDTKKGSKVKKVSKK